MREIPSLYGLRGAAALAVVVFHYTLGHGKFADLFPGPFAVTLFFELSGLLITWLLLKEISQRGTLDRRQFYLRRALRLFPVFYVVWILCRLEGPFAGSWATFVYMGDYYHAFTQRYNILTVGWSLGVEEKFYLLWPFLLVRIERNRLVKILFGVLIFEPIYRSALTLLGYRTYTWFAFDTRLDPIVLGCLIAIAAKNGWTPPKWLSHPTTPLCALILVFALQSQSDAVTYLLAVILVSVVCRPPALLNHPLARYFGAISYSLYLSHDYAREILLPHLLRTLHIPNLPNFALLLASQFLLAIVLASALHYAIERPFLHLKDRFHKRTSID
ncbi:MAG TPA: acyltransferase [Candidatus Acidoferrales bacterium]|nr:acyltransferase [Candidatus Acidoferrales bacterium]